MAEVGVLDIFLEVRDQELLAVASLCRAKPLNCAGTLSAVANGEDAAIGGESRALDLRVENKVN